MPSFTSSRIKPPALKPGDAVGIVAPASSIKRDLLQKGCQALEKQGYRPLFVESIFERDLYFAGSAKRRTQELEEMFLRDDVKAIVCARGGYGANYLLPLIDLAKIKAHPKIFLGYSDITTLLTYLADAAGLVTFHGPMAAKDWAHDDGIDLESWQAALSGASGWEVHSNSGAVGLVSGAAEGILYGGCLSMMAASLGTPYEIRTEGTILFMEDLAAKPYQVDRMLMQLHLGGKFQGVRGIVFGEMLDCVQSSEQSYKLEDVVIRIVGGLGIPVAYGLRSGHVTRQNITLPLGVKARLQVSAKDVSLTILESATLSTAVRSDSAR